MAIEEVLVEEMVILGEETPFMIAGEESTGDSILLGTTTTLNASSNVEVQELIQLNGIESSQFVINFLLNDNINITDFSNITREVLETVEETINLTDSSALSRNVAIFVDEILSLNTTQTNNLISNETVEETIRLGFSIVIDGQIYNCYCINIENNALTRYENYDFESFFQYRNNYYGVKSDGIYLLDGETDNGIDITSKFRTGFFNIANLETKSQGLSSLRLNKSRLDCGYAIIKNNGQVIFRIFNDSGEKFDYTLNDAYNNEKFKFQIGRGNRGSYYQLEVETTGNFKLDECVIIPIVLERKI